MSWNFDEGVEEGVDFKLGGKMYRFRYPTTEEAMLSKKVKEDEQLEYLFNFVQPIDTDAPDFRETMLKANVQVLKKFTEMVKTVLKVD